MYGLSKKRKNCHYQTENDEKNDSKRNNPQNQYKVVAVHVCRCLMLLAAFFAIELFAYLLLKPQDPLVLVFGLLWAMLIASLLYAIPRKVSRIVFGVVYYVIGLWSVAQIGYYQIFGKLMWITSSRFAGEGAEFLGGLLSNFTALFWIGSLLLIGIGVLVIVFYPKTAPTHMVRAAMLLPVTVGIVALALLPEAIFVRDNDVWGTRSE